MSAWHYPRIAGRIFNTPLMVDEGKLNTILAALMPRFTGQTSAVEQRTAGGYESARDLLSIDQGVAVISVTGTLINKKGAMEAESGLTSYNEILSALDMAVADGRVNAIILNIDSPGGEADGCAEAAQEIFAMRGSKPIIAVANSLMASAAYFIGSAADIIFTTGKGLVGSIGTVCAHLDVSESDAKQGYKYTFVAAGKHKLDLNPHQPITESGLDLLTRMVNAYYDDFVAGVVRNRGMSDAAVRGTEAQIYFGDDAVRAGLVDGVSTLEAVFAELAAGRLPQALRASKNNPLHATTTKEKVMSTANTNNQPGTENPNAPENEENKENGAEPAPAAPAPAAPEESPADDKAAAAASAALAERTRVAGIYATCEKLGLSFAHAKSFVDGGVSLAKANAQLIDIAAESSPAKGIRSAHTAAPAESNDNAQPLEERCKSAWDKDAKLRAEFKDNYQSFLAFSKAEEKGHARLFRKTGN